MRIHRLALLPCLLSLLALPAACGGDDAEEESDVVVFDEASDEVALTILDLKDRGEVTVDDDIAAALTTPEDGAALAAGEPAELTWALAQARLRHGRTTGDFVVVDVECGGLDPIVAVAI